MPASRSTSACRSAGTSMGTPSASTTSALPARLETARLPCLATCTPSDETTMAAAVDTFRVPSPSPPVPHVSSVAGSP